MGVHVAKAAKRLLPPLAASRKSSANGEWRVAQMLLPHSPLATRYALLPISPLGHNAAIAYRDKNRPSGPQQGS
jgi:hypothetical protein